jgi:hypothetical protein
MYCYCQRKKKEKCIVLKKNWWLNPPVDKNHKVELNIKTVGESKNNNY